MNPTNRRAFLTMAGTGAAAAGLVVVAPNVSAAPAAAPAAPVAPASHAPLVAHVVDAKAGKVVVMVNGRETTVTDKALAARLAQIAASLPAV